MNARELILSEAHRRRKSSEEAGEPNLTTYFKSPYGERVAASQEFLDPEYDPHATLQDRVAAPAQAYEEPWAEIKNSVPWPKDKPKTPHWTMVQPPPARPPNPISGRKRPTYNWNAVDWSKSDTQIARQTGANMSAVYLNRRRIAPKKFMRSPRRGLPLDYPRQTDLKLEALEIAGRLLEDWV